MWRSPPARARPRRTSRQGGGGERVERSGSRSGPMPIRFRSRSSRTGTSYATRAASCSAWSASIRAVAASCSEMSPALNRFSASSAIRPRSFTPSPGDPHPLLRQHHVGVGLPRVAHQVETGLREPLGRAVGLPRRRLHPDRAGARRPRWASRRGTCTACPTWARSRRTPGSGAARPGSGRRGRGRDRRAVRGTRRCSTARSRPPRPPSGRRRARPRAAASVGLEASGAGPCARPAASGARTPPPGRERAASGTP